MERRAIGFGWRLLAGALLAGVIAGGAGGAASAQAAAQEPAPDATLELPKPVTLFLLGRPRATVTFEGAYGPVRLTGAVEGAPRAALALTNGEGARREVAWTQLRSISRVSLPSEGLPAGSFRVSLLSDPINPTPGGGFSRLLGTGRDEWRLSQIPEGELTLSGSPYGRITIPTARVSLFEMEPVRGNVTEFPAGTVRVEVLAGKTIDVPLGTIQWFQRDVQKGTLALQLTDGQSFTGKLVELPKAVLRVETETGPVPIPLEDVAQFERTVPGIRRL